jgi:hypothetical protein
MSYGMTDAQGKILFPGDTILGVESVCFDNLELYLADLHRLKAMKFDLMCLVHT